MAQQAEQKSEKKALPVMLILQGVFALVNLSVVGGGAYLVYNATIGWQSPQITEKSLRIAERKQKSGAGGHDQRAPASAESAPAEEAAAPASSGGGEHGGGGTAAAGEHGHGESAGPLLQKLDKFVVNLADNKRSIQLEINLELLNEESYEEIMEVHRLPKIRDRIISILNDKTFADLEGIQGKLFLKDRIASEINGLLDEGVVKDVFFSEFVVK